MRKFYLKALALAVVLGSMLGSVQAQICGTLSYEEEIRANDNISQAEKEQLIEAFYKEEAEMRASWPKSRSGEKAEIAIIPVVFHIFHKYGPENISKAQIDNQIKVLNDDYNGKNASMSQLVEQFKSIAGNTEVEFRLATLDPNGNCTNGVIRYYDPKTYYDGRNPIQQLKVQHGWPRENYMNIYVVGSIENNGSGTVLGYAQFPGFGAANTDGLVVRSDNVGAIGTSSPARATTSTHEVGHWLGLFHTWGNCAAAGSPNACNCDDDVTDTPNTVGHPSTCNLAAETCGSLDNVQNFMDYATCAVNFTAEQATRMRDNLLNHSNRRVLSTEANLIATGSDYGIGDEPTTLCKAVMEFNEYDVFCPGDAVKFTDRSFHKVTTRTWTFQDGTPATSSDASPSVTFDSPGLKDVSLTVSNGVETKTVDAQIYIRSDAELGGFPYSDDIEAVDISNNDQYQIIDNGGNAKWTLSSTVSSGGGSKSFYLPNANSVSEELDEIISNTIDLSGASEGAKFTFDVAYARKAFTNSDQLKVSFTNDCGATWTNFTPLTRNTLATAPNHTNSFFPDGPDEWATKEFEIPASLLGPNFQFKFTWIASGGNNAFIDNINISQNGVGINDAFASQIGVDIYPNPASNQVTIDLAANSNLELNIRLVNLLGKEVISVYNGNVKQGNQEFTVNTSSLEAGVYFVTIDNGTSSKTEKLVITK